MNQGIDKPVMHAQDKVTLVINTCDAYQDIWPMFFHALEDYWPNRTCTAVLNTEAKNIDFSVDNLIVHNVKNQNGHDQWGMRLIETLQNIKTDYVMVVYDDFILESAFDSEKLNTLIEYMETNKNIAVFYLTTMGLPIATDERYAHQGLILDKIDFRLNSAPALWRRQDLIRYTGLNDTPWAWEQFGSYRTFGDGRLFFAPIAPAYDVFIYNYKKGGAIYRGKWVSEVVVPKREKYNLNVDFNLRGFASESKPEKRSLMWKIKFILLGFKMVRFRIFYFFLGYAKAKLK